MTINEQLESIRKAIRAENVSYGEIYFLQCCVSFIKEDDIELLEWAGVPEDFRKIVEG